MPHQSFTRPFYIFFIVLPSGISTGFVTVALPYLLTHQGFSVAATAGIVAIGVSANLWRFLWGPVADLTLSLRKWFWIGILSCVATLLLLCVTPFSPKTIGLLSVVVFLSQVAATLILLPAGSFMANRIEEKRKGKASGWYQAGNLCGLGLGGGAGLWLATHYSIVIAGLVLSVVSVLFALTVFLIQDVQKKKDKSIVTEIVVMGKDIVTMLKIPIVFFAIVMICLPIGTGAAQNLWSAVAPDWKADADTVALVTGILSGMVSAIGCVLGGFIADRRGVWVSYLGAGMVCAIITAAMALFPYLPVVYTVGVLAYAFSMGMAYAAFSAVILFAIGKRNAATKFSLLSSLGNLPVVYTTAFDGWAHDKFNSKYMLVAEATAGILFILLSVLILNRLKAGKLLLTTVEQ